MPSWWFRLSFKLTCAVQGLKINPTDLGRRKQLQHHPHQHLGGMLLQGQLRAETHQGIVLSDGVVGEPAALRQGVHTQAKVGACARNIPAAPCTGTAGLY